MRDPDCNRVDLDDEGEPEDNDFSECVNTFGLQDSDEEGDDE